MSARRSKRERKKINYAAFGDNDDDDFADPSPHERKKSALANKENKDKSKKSERAVKPVKGTQRLSLEEKLFERDLQAALNLSVSESQESSDGIEALKPEDNSHQVTVTVESAPPLSSVKSSVTEPDVTSGKVDQADTDLKPGSDHQSQHVITVRKRPAEVEEDEVIQILESDILSGEQPSKRRRVTSAPKKSKYVDSDSDGSEFGMDSDSDESFSEGDDSDFDGSKSKSKASKASSATKTKAVPAAVTKTKPADTKTKPAPAAKVESAPPLSSVKSSVTEPDVTSGKVDQSDTDLKPGSDHQSQHVITARKRPAEVEEDEVIQILESDILSGEQPSKRRRVTSAPKKSKYVDSDSDGSEFGMDSDSDESFSEGDDSDFDDGSKSKSKASKASSATKTKPVPAAVTKTKPVPAAVSKTTLAVTKTKPAPAAKVQKPATQLQSTTGKTTSVVRKSVSSPGGATVSPQNRPKASTKGPKTSWTPPALSSSCKSAVGGNAMTSPSAGIRLGLSRNQRVKSLHPSLRVQQ